MAHVSTGKRPRRLTKEEILLEEQSKVLLKAGKSPFEVYKELKTKMPLSRIEFVYTCLRREGLPRHGKRHSYFVPKEPHRCRKSQS